MRLKTILLLGVCVLAGRGGESVVAADGEKRPVVATSTAAQVEFFENQIRPVLSRHCYSCHSSAARPVKGGLLLDTREGIRKGGDTGAAVVPGKAAESLLLDALRWEGGLQMPPAGKLPPSVIQDFETWIASGAADPRETAPVRKSTAPDFATARRHWSFQPIRLPPVPAVAGLSPQSSEIDQFIAEKLAARKLTMSPVADRRTLIRRAYFDLWGLPPTFAEVEAFVRDPAGNAFENLVDRLLAGPHYGERWGRHWLDIARYADTKDSVLLYGKDKLRPYAYTYRDYVIRALNADTPYHQFLKEQIAADQLQPAVEPWRLAGMGFLTLGRQFDANFPDVIDDRLDTLFRGTQALTVACARCHDHKSDPIPTADYYSLYGVFSNCDVPLNLPLLAPLSETPGGAEFQRQTANALLYYNRFLDQQYAMLHDDFCRRIGDYLLKVTEKPDPLETAVFVLVLRHIDLRPPVIAAWRNYLTKSATADHPVWGPWRELLNLPEAEISSRAPAIVAHWLKVSPGTAPGQLNPLVQRALRNASLHSRADVARLYGDLFLKVYLSVKGPDSLLTAYMAKQEAERAPKKPALNPPAKKLPPAGEKKAAKPAAPAGVGTAAPVKPSSVEKPVAVATARVSAPAPFVPASLDAAGSQLWDILVDPDGPLGMSRGQTHYYLARAEEVQLENLGSELDKLAVHAERTPPPRGMVLADFARITEPRILVRGIALQPGPTVPRQFLRILAGDDRQPFLQGSGRRELAEAIASSRNPLTARVMVNRVWQQHFGEPLVSTPSDFGLRSAPPTHPELLDWLASTFMREGWSLKKLHRRILLSRSWQQSSEDRGECHAVDPDNRWWWRARRRRLDLEAMRDSLLAIAGRLDSTLYGRPEDGLRDAAARRRTIYGIVDRQDLPAAYRAFDFANPDSSTERRPVTTVPQQALFGMNSPFVLQQARALAGSADISRALDARGQIVALYLRVLARLPSELETVQGVEFLTAAAADPQYTPPPPRSSVVASATRPRPHSYEAPDPTAATADRPLSPLEQYAQVLLLTNEFMFVD